MVFNLTKCEHNDSGWCLGCVTNLYKSLNTEEQQHKSVINAAKGREHAWYCTYQLGNDKCNCPYGMCKKLEKIKEVLR